MPELARTPSRPPARVTPQPTKTKVLLVRQPVKSVRKSDEVDRTSLRLAIGVITALGIVAAVWLLGYLGYRLGFAPLMRVPDLMVEGGSGLATGTLMLISLPRVILQAGIAQPMWLMLGFAMIAIPAASLGAIGPTAPGGPRPKPAAVFISFAGSIAASLNALALLAWTVAPYRNHLINELPYEPAEASQWLADLQTVGGLDILATIAAALWVVVVMRLAIPLWLRGVSASACLFALVVIAVAMSMTNAAVAQITAARSVFFLDDASLETRLVLGFTPRSFVTLNVSGNRSIVELRDRPAVLEVIRTQSIVDYLEELAPRE